MTSGVTLFEHQVLALSDCIVASLFEHQVLALSDCTVWTVWTVRHCLDCLDCQTQPVRITWCREVAHCRIIDLSESLSDYLKIFDRGMPNRAIGVKTEVSSYLSDLAVVFSV